MSAAASPDPAEDTIDVAGNLATVRAEIADAATEAGRAAGEIGLVAVTKTHGPARIRPALVAGHRLFGENRVQEAERKWPDLRAEWPDSRLHLVGPLQGNKARSAVELFDCIETIDRPRIARRVADAVQATGHGLDCFVQVNTGAEAQKAGVMPEEADGFIAQCRDEFGLIVEGLMCLPPLDEEPSLHFALLAGIARRNAVPGLSMGMSADYPVAIQFGATLVRVGTAIFGPRGAY